MRQYAPLRQHRVHTRATAPLAYRRVSYNPPPPGNQSIEKAIAVKSRLINHASLRRVRKATRTGQTRRKRSASSRSFVSLSRASPACSISLLRTSRILPFIPSCKLLQSHIIDFEETPRKQTFEGNTESASRFHV